MTSAPISERLLSARTKLCRAKRHFEELKSTVQGYLSAQPYVLGSRLDPESTRRIYFVADIRPTPLEIPAVLGDTIHNLRSTLDHLAYQAVFIGTGKAPSRHVYFPVADDATKYVTQRDRQMPGARPDVINAIDVLAPYRGGNDIFWRIHKLDNIDKHRMLITAGSAFQSVDIGAVMRREMQKMRDASPDFAGMSLPHLELFLKPADRLFPLKIGDQLFIDAPNAPEDPNMRFKFELAFSEAGIIAGEPILETVEPMIKTVEDAVSALAPLLQ